MDGYLSAGDKSHFPNAPAKFSSDLDRPYRAGLAFLHLSEYDCLHIHFSALKWFGSLHPEAEQHEQPLPQEIFLPGVMAARH